MHHSNHPSQTVSRIKTSRAILAGSIVALMALSVGIQTGAAQAISISTPSGSYSQDFNTLPSTGNVTFVNDSTIPGWYAQRTGNGTTIVADTGSGTGGNLYSYGSAALPADRTLGSLGSGNVAAGHFAWGVEFLNNSGGTLSLDTLGFTGEQWRNSAAAAQTITFWYQISAAPITGVTPNVNTTWTAFTALDFASPITGGTSGALDGNAAANRTVKSSTLGLSLPVGSYVMFRWSDVDHTGTDHGLGIDDVNFAWSTSTYVPKSLTWNPPTNSWNTSATNWLNGVTPVAFTNTDNVFFTNAGLAAGSTVNVDVAGIVAGDVNVQNTTGSYTFTGGAIGGNGTLNKSGAGELVLGTSYTGAINVTGGSVKLSGSNRIADGAGVIVGSGTTLDLDGNSETVGNLTLTGGTVQTGAGVLTFTGDLASNADSNFNSITGTVALGTAIRNLTTAVGSTLNLDAVLTGAGGSRLQISGLGSVELNGVNSSFAGNIQVNSGVTLTLGNKQALGTGTFFLNGGNIIAASDFTATEAITNPVSLGGSPTFTGSNPFEFTAGWLFFQNTPKTITADVPVVITGNITGTGAGAAVTVTGIDTVQLEGAANSFTSLTIDGGTVNIGGETTLSGGLNIINSGLLGGDGTIIGNVLVTNGTINPRLGPIPTADSTTTLTITGDLTIGASGGLALQISGTSPSPGLFDSLSVSGLVTLDPSSGLTLSSGILDYGSTYTLLANGGTDAIAGTFFGKAEGSVFSVQGGQEFLITYVGGTDNNDIVLTAVPEPGSAMLLLGGVALLGASRRRRQS